MSEDRLTREWRKLIADVLSDPGVDGELRSSAERLACATPTLDTVATFVDEALADALMNGGVADGELNGFGLKLQDYINRATIIRLRLQCT